MDSSGEQLHPNWRALTTIHYPLKRFVQSGRLGAAVADRDIHAKKHEILGVSGAEVRQFYEEMIKVPPTTSCERTKRPKAETTRCVRATTTTARQERHIPFESQKFFRYATSNDVEELRKFSYHEGDVNVRDSFGWTALMMAACAGATEVVEYLLQLGADKTTRDRRGNTALTLASIKRHQHIVALLEQMSVAKESPAETAANAEPHTPFYCSTCQRTFTETSFHQHQTSTVHQFNVKSDLPANKLQKFNIPSRNRGLQLMVKQGWDKESGLGPTQSGRLYPVKTVIRKQRTGLGIDQPPARVTHFEAFDLRATQRQGAYWTGKKPRSRNDIRREKQREWKRERRLRNELS